MLHILLICIGGYLTWHTFKIAKRTWKEGNKLAGAFVFALTACFLPLALYINIH
jgi:hypothetical protein